MSNNMNDQLARMKALMNYGAVNESESLSKPYTLEYKHQAADGSTYGIVKECQKYYIKKAQPGKENIAECYQYLTGFNNKKDYEYTSFAGAQRNFDLKMRSINEAHGIETSYDSVNIDRRDEIIAEGSDKMKSELYRMRQIMNNAAAILNESGIGKTPITNQPEAAHGNSGDEDTPFTSSVKPDMEFDGETEKCPKCASDPYCCNGGSCKCGKSVKGKDITVKDSVASMHPHGAKAVKMNEEITGDDIYDEDNVIPADDDDEFLSRVHADMDEFDEDEAMSARDAALADMDDDVIPNIDFSEKDEDELMFEAKQKKKSADKKKKKVGESDEDVDDEDDEDLDMDDEDLDIDDDEDEDLDVDDDEDEDEEQEYELDIDDEDEDLDMDDDEDDDLEIDDEDEDEQEYELELGEGSNSDAGAFLGTIQQSIVEAWKSHFSTDKYSEHKALNDFYEEALDLADELIEDYQGIHGKVGKLTNTIEVSDDVVSYLNELREFIVDGKDAIIGHDTEIGSDIDAILSLIDKTLYQLNELSESKNSLNNIIDEEVLHVFGKHHGYRKKPMQLPHTGHDANKHGKDINHSSVHSEAPFGEKIGDSMPYTKNVQKIADSVFESLVNSGILKKK